MVRSVFRAALFAFAISVPVLASALPAGAEIVPLRSGKVVSSEKAKAFSYIKAVDKSGEEFWVLTAICTVSKGGEIEVLSGTRYDEVRSESPDFTFKDVYSAHLIRVNGEEIRGFGAHGLPDGCITLD